jgi:hypothetical protein
MAMTSSSGKKCFDDEELQVEYLYSDQLPHNIRYFT